MTKWPRFSHCKTRLAKAIGKKNALKIQQKMLNHTVSVAKFLKKKNIADVSIAMKGMGLKSCNRWCKSIGVDKFALQGKGCLGEKMKRQTIINYKGNKNQQKRNIIFIGTDLPDLCHMDILQAISKLEKTDVVLGPSNDGGYWLIAFSKKILSDNMFLPFININWSSENVLKETIYNLKAKKISIDLIDTKIDIDTIKDIDEKNKTINNNSSIE